MAVSQLRGLRVLLLARYGATGASSRVRHYDFIPYLAKRGIEITINYLIDDESLANFYLGRSRNWRKIARAYARRLRLLQDLRRFDLIWLEKEGFPGLPYLVERAILQNSRIPVVLDFDDLWTARNGKFAPNRIFAAQEARKHRLICRSASVITAANAQLSAALEDATGRRPIIINNYIDASIYKAAADAYDANRSIGRLPTIGWIGTPYTADLYLPPVAEFMNRLSGEGLSKTILIGAALAAPEITAERIEWHLESEADAVAEVDIGIAPLLGDPFDWCKSGWKIYQFMAAGRPVVASKIGFNEELIKDGETGFLARSPQEFEGRLRLLLHDSQLRSEMGKKAHDSIVSRYNIEEGADIISRLFYDTVTQWRRPH